MGFIEEDLSSKESRFLFFPHPILIISKSTETKSTGQSCDHTTVKQTYDDYIQ